MPHIVAQGLELKEFRLGEGKGHRKLKELGRLILTGDRHYPPDTVHEEYGVIVDGKQYKVDLVGIYEPLGKTAVECGDTDSVKVLDLKKVFDSIIVLDYSWIVESIFHLKEEADKLIDQYNEMRNDYENKIRELTSPVVDTGGKKAQQLRIRCTKTLFEKFQVFVREKRFDSYNDALVELLNYYREAESRRELERLKIGRIAVEPAGKP